MMVKSYRFKEQVQFLKIGFIVRQPMLMDILVLLKNNQTFSQNDLCKNIDLF
jgi:hypothetical protein